MDRLIDVSFVITVYNMEKYVKDCLESVVKQDNDECSYEIIVVDDGSTDESLSVIRQFASQYSNIKVIEQTNAGLSVARNNGLELAQGKWVWFIDSDDMVSRSSLSIIKEFERQNDVDAIVFSVENFSDTSKYLFADRSKMNVSVLKSRDYLRLGIPCQVPFTIYKRSHLVENHLRMMPGVYHEDMEFSPRAYYFLCNIGVLPDILYYRRLTPNSITHSINWKKSFDCIIVADSLNNFSQYVSKEDRYIFFDFSSRVLDHSLLDNLKMDEGTKERFVKFVCANRHLFKNMRKSSRFKYKIQGFLYTLFPQHILCIYNFLYRHSHAR